VVVGDQLFLHVGAKPAAVGGDPRRARPVILSASKLLHAVQVN
jgi:hypothetical protein